MKKKRGVTLIELLIAMVLLTIMMISFTNVYVFGMKTYSEQFVQTRLNSEAQTIIDRLSSDVNFAQSVEASYSSYNTSDSVLILKTPAVDSSQNFIYSGGSLVFDRFVYYRQGSSLHRVTFADAASARFGQNNEDKILTQRLASLTFDYDPDAIVPTAISTTITLSQPVGKATKTITLTGKSALRNSL